jgi:hypothetical protein
MIQSYLLYLLVALTATILVEWALSWLFFKTRRDRIVVILAQCATNPLVNLWLILSNYHFGAASLIIAEICAIIAEYFIYRKNCQQQKRLAVFSIVTNICSFSLGLIASSWQI